MWGGGLAPTTAPGCGLAAQKHSVLLFAARRTEVWAPRETSTLHWWTGSGGVVRALGGNEMARAEGGGGGRCPFPSPACMSGGDDVLPTEYRTCNNYGALAPCGGLACGRSWVVLLLGLQAMIGTSRVAEVAPYASSGRAGMRDVRPTLVQQLATHRRCYHHKCASMSLTYHPTSHGGPARRWSRHSGPAHRDTVPGPRDHRVITGRRGSGIRGGRGTALGSPSVRSGTCLPRPVLLRHTPYMPRRRIIGEDDHLSTPPKRWTGRKAIPVQWAVCRMQHPYKAVID